MKTSNGQAAAATPPAELVEKPSPVKSPPRVVVEIDPKHEAGRLVQQYANGLIQLAGLHGTAATQWVAEAVDAAERFCLSNRGKAIMPDSVFRSIKNGAGLGLSFNGTLGQLYLVPFKNGELSKRHGKDVYEAQLIVGYQGYEALAYGLNWMDSLFVEVVLQEEIEADRFDYWHDESGPHLKHRPLIPRVVPRSLRDGQNEIALAYASWRTVRGSVGCAVADKGRIARAVKQASDMWRFDFPAGAKKTAIREAAKHWPKARTLAGALTLDDQAELAVSQDDVTGRRIAEIERGPEAISGPLPGDVAGLGDDDADASPAFRGLWDQIEARKTAPQATADAIDSAADLRMIDERQAARLHERLAEIAATPRPTETFADDELPY